MKIIVKGMTCGHCVKSIKEKLAALGGISNIQVDLQSGTVSFDESTSHGAEEIRGAVEDAGFELSVR